MGRPDHSGPKMEPQNSVPHREDKSLDRLRYSLSCAIQQWKVVVRDV
jgi:hypothetical protein